MLVKTTLNRVQKFKSFVYGPCASWKAGGTGTGSGGACSANSGPMCSGCGQSGPGHDRLAARRFEFVPLWGMKVFLVYAPRRVRCWGCGTRGEDAVGGGQASGHQAYAWFLAHCKRLLNYPIGIKITDAEPSGLNLKLANFMATGITHPFRNDRTLDQLMFT